MSRPARRRNLARIRRCSGSRIRFLPMPVARFPDPISCFKLLSGTYRSMPRSFIAYSAFPLYAMKDLGIDLYVPDNNLKHEMGSGKRATGIGKNRIRDPEHRRMRAKLRRRAGRDIYQRRQALVEPVFGILKEQRGMRKFRRRGLAAVTTEWILAAIAYNITRMLRG